ncbi:Two-component signal transduction system YycFG, regulatory protein YycH [Terribacillus saccharophilus]|uniref:Two-component signal transduction system YycFG, regulatory protein YycH n=2 Tax=Terribacillus saccharophilus TaxID=361277 RepID=A0AAX2EJ86_9BACI|nr:Two-component signal transduction system YycFG, regulatory protein YycH [Terribacillus saccharophilus]
METFNTILLIILVALSLVLTAYVWTFQPNSLKSEGIGTEEPKTLAGVEKQLADVVRPSHTYVNKNDNHFVFYSKTNEQTFLNGLSEWNLTDIERKDLPELPDTSIELVYPVAVSFSQLNNLFQVEGAENVTNRLGNSGFTRIYLSPNENGSTGLVFLNEHQENPLENVVTATVTNSIDEILNNEYLTAAVPLSETNAWNQIYLPEKINVSDSIVRSETISRNAFADIYMEDPSIQGSDQYIDTNRLESVQFSNSGQFASYSYSNPSSSSIGTVTRADQLQAAISTINSHKGWTNDFSLYAVSGEGSYTFQFRMVRNGYPVFQANGLSLMSIRMQNNLPDPVSYDRTLLNIGTTGNSEGNYSLESKEVQDWIEDNQYSRRDIDDVVIGYKLEEYEESEIFKYHMKPCWYVKYQGNWLEVESSTTGGKD